MLDQVISNDIQIMLDQTFWLLPNWKWFALGAAALGGWMLRPLATYFIRKLTLNERLSSSTPPLVSAVLRSHIERPLGVIFITLFWFSIIDFLALPATLDKYLTILVRIVFSYHFLVTIYRAVDGGGRFFEAKVKFDTESMQSHLIPFATKSLKVAVVVLGSLIILQSFGVNVMSLLAGLGLGGLALALAAQDTAANVFGSITILMDRPFKVGDWIKVTDTEGVVEEIGFRSTRIRTFYKSLITIPNSTIAKEKVDNMGERPQRRIRHILGVTYETSPGLIASFCEGIKELLRNHPLVDKETFTVFFTAYSSSSLDVTVNFFLNTDDIAVELTTQQDVLLAVLELANQMGVSFAYPTHTIHMAKPTETRV